jgi:L-asparaginase II
MDARPTTRKPAGGSGPATRTPRSTAPPVLVRHVRNRVVESVHRGDIVEVDVSGRMLRVLGDPERVVMLRSTVKPFGAVTVLEACAAEEFDLSPAEIALLTSSHSGEDLHVRTLQGLFRRASISQTVLACGSEGMPLDALTAARLARDGEKASPVRHMCSGQHAGLILLARLRDWPIETYWEADHPAQQLYRETVARAFAVPPERLRTGIDGCGLLTYAFPLREVAKAYAMLADPEALPPSDPRASLLPHLVTVRDAMLAHPEMVAGNRDRLDTSLMKAASGRLVSKSGMEALRGIAILPGPRAGRAGTAASGMAVKIEDGDGHDRGTWAASIEALRQAGVLERQALRVLGRYQRPTVLDPHGRVGAESIAEFDLVPVGELTT